MQSEKEGLVSQSKGNLVGMVSSPECFLEVSKECLTVYHLSERSDQMKACPLNPATWRSLGSLVSGTSLE